jgi:hypothetical protein
VSESPINGQNSDGSHGDDGQASEPESERPAAWSVEWGSGRFTEPPNRPSAERTGDAQAKPSSARSGDGQGKASSARPGDRQGKASSARPGDRQGKASGARPGDRQGKPSGERQGKASSDPVNDFQRWLMKAGARSMANQVAGNVRRSLGQQSKRRDKGDIWDTATTELPQDEPPECQWCPVCQAARRIRVSGPGLGDRLASASGVLASVVQDAFSAVEQVIKVPPPDEGRQERSS